MSAHPRFPVVGPSAVLLLLVMLPAGCGRQGSPTDPRSGAVGLLGTAGRAYVTAPALPGAGRRGVFRRIWPHEDGRFWSYRATQRDWDATFPSVVQEDPGDLSTLTLDDVQALLGRQAIGEDPTTSTAGFGLRFHGVITTESGVTKQWLEESSSDPGARSAGRAAAGTASSSHRGLREMLLRARPDLAAKLGGADPVSRGPDSARRSASGAATVHPTLLFGYAWEQTEEWVASYGDLNQEISWLYLTSNLEPGADFSLQLIPDLAGDVWLHARVLGWRAGSARSGAYHRAIEILYLIDFGVGETTGELGGPIGSFRSYTYGTVAYAPGVGPVQSYERMLVEPGNPPTAGVGDLTLELLETGPGPAGRVASTGP